MELSDSIYDKNSAGADLLYFPVGKEEKNAQ
jgi:hypothetical protein